jgi:hypothetical protein
VNTDVYVCTSASLGYIVDGQRLFRSVVALPCAVAGFQPTRPAAGNPMPALCEVDFGGGAGMLLPGVVAAVSDQGQRHDDRQDGADNAASSTAAISRLLRHGKRR